MYTLVCTSHKDRHLDTGFLHQWNKYMGSIQCDIFQTEWSAWVGSIRRKLETIVDDTVLLMLSDYWITASPNWSTISLAVDLIKDGAIDKFDLTDQVKYWGHTNKSFGGRELLVAERDAMYRQSTQAAVWSKRSLHDYFTKPESDPWKWETGTWSKFDNKVIVGDVNKSLHYANVMLKGKKDNYQWGKLNSVDQKELVALGYEGW